MTQILLPNDWQPRPYQLAPWEYFQNGGKRGALLWHRRAGKDSFAINLLATLALQKKGVYWYMAPTAAQIRKIIWKGIDGQGRNVLDQAIPKQIIKKKNEAEMLVELVNGSIIQLVGSDNYDSLVGANPIGVIFSEYAIADPLGYDYIRPILAENNGWQLFISTARGKNHFYKIFKAFENDPTAFTDVQTVTSTEREDGSPVITPEAIEEERSLGMPEDMIQQEFYCSWEGGMQGAFYTAEIKDIKENRMINMPTPVHELTSTFWDIGIGDPTAIGFIQRLPHSESPLLVHYHEDRNQSLEHYIKHIKNLPFILETHYGPHDMDNREYTTAQSRADFAADLGINFNILPKMPVADGINQTRRFLRQLYVLDTPSNQIFLDHLAQYRRQYNPKTKTFSDKPFHDFASNPADMIRYAAQGWNPQDLQTRPQTRFVIKTNGTKIPHTAKRPTNGRYQSHRQI